MTSSGMPVFSARVALCSTWLAGAKRFSKNSRRVGFDPTSSAASPRGDPSRLLALNRLPPPRAHPQLLRLARASISATVGNLVSVLLGRDQPVQRFFHVVLERVGFLLRGHQRHRASPAEARNKGATIDVHEVLPAGVSSRPPAISAGRPSGQDAPSPGSPSSLFCRSAHRLRKAAGFGDFRAAGRLAPAARRDGTPRLRYSRLPESAPAVRRRGARSCGGCRQ